MERMVSQALAESEQGLELGIGTTSPNLSVSPGIPFLTQDDPADIYENDLSSSDEEAGAVQLSYGMQKLTIDSTLQRFFGKSSGAVFLMTAMDMKNKYVKRDEAGTMPKVFGVKRPEYWSAQPVSTSPISPRSHSLFSSGFLPKFGPQSPTTHFPRTISSGP
jgi:hypothetical protein